MPQHVLVTTKASHLQEVIKYVEALKDRVTALEAAQNLPLTCPPTNKEVSKAVNFLPSVDAPAQMYDSVRSAIKTRLIVDARVHASSH